MHVAATDDRHLCVRMQGRLVVFGGDHANASPAAARPTTPRRAWPKSAAIWTSGAPHC